MVYGQLSFYFGVPQTVGTQPTITNTITAINWTALDSINSNLSVWGIQAYIYGASNSYVTAALYFQNLTLIQQTQELYIPSTSTTSSWINFSSPVTLQNNTAYWIAIWGNGTGLTLNNGGSRSSAYGRKAFQISATYNGSFPQTLSPSSYTDDTWGLQAAYNSTATLLANYTITTAGLGLAASTPSSASYASAAGMTFQINSTNTYVLTQAQFYVMDGTGSPTGTDAKVSLYACTGTYGVDAKK